MIRHDLADQREAEAGAVLAPRHERIEDVARDIRRKTGAIVDHLDLQGQGLAQTVAAAQAEGMFVIGPQSNGSARLVSSFRGVLDEVQHHLQQLVGIAPCHRQRGVIILDDLHMRAESQKRRPAGAVQHIVDIHLAPVGRAQVAELFDLFQQFDDPAAFLDDQIGQLHIFGTEAHGQKLCRAGDARKRVLDLMRQHLGHADGGFGGGLHRMGMRHPARQFTRRDEQDHETGLALHRRDLKVAMQRHTLARAHIHVIDEKRGRGFAGALERLLHGRIDHHAIPDRLPAHGFDRGVQEKFCCRVGVCDHVLRIKQQGRNRKRGPQGGIVDHAACLPVWAGAWFRASGSRASTSAGVFAVSTRWRSVAPVPA